MNIDELANIVEEEHDQFAIYAMIEKNDSTAIPYLENFLLNSEFDLTLRIVAANALGQLGGRSAYNILTKAYNKTDNEHLRKAIQYAIETIDRTNIPD